VDDLMAELDRRLAAADAALAADYRGDRGVRQPIHTVYVPADRYDARTVDDWGAQARAALRREALDEPEPGVMPGRLVLVARVTEADDQFHMEAVISE